ncbi:MAG: SLC45 family MFS transporter [Bacteroidetes bacterium]|nr:SLC45 family MFS transporter [Bacteroidota bacterium]
MLTIQKKLTNLFYSILSLPATAMGFALSIQIAVLSWILSTKYNLDIHQVGIVWAAGPIAGILGQVIIGFISDKTWFWGGRRRPFILIGGTLAALMIIALPNINEINDFLGIGSLMSVAIVIAVTLDMAINISFNPTRSLIADVTPEGVARTKGYTWMQTISGFFGVFAYIFGAIFGNYMLIYVGACITLLFSILPTFFIKEPRVLDMLVEGEATQIKRKVNWINLLKIYFAHAFTWLGIQTMFVYIFAYISQFQFNITDLSTLNTDQKNDVGQIIAIAFAILNTVGFILPALVLQPLAKKIGTIYTHIACVFIMALGYWGIVLYGNSPFTLYFLMAIAGIGWASVVSLPFAIVSELVDRSKMGFFMGIFNLSVVIPQLIVSLFIGSFIQAANDKVLIFIISAVSLTISGFLWFLVKKKND